MVNKIKNSPWNELDYYKEGQRLYGRDNEVHKVTDSILQNLQTTLYGQSGIGKSSLLFAGVFPKLRKEYYFPIFIRLGMSNDDSYVDTVINAILKEAERVDKHIGKEKIKCETIIDLPQDKEECFSQKLWNFLNSTKFTGLNGNEYIPVLVFDQFEEVLNNIQTHKKAKTFLLDIYTLLDDTSIIPEGCVPYSNFRFVLSLREDYLYCLEDIIDKYNLSEFRYNRFRISAMNEKSAKEVILNTSREAGGCLEEGKEEEICAKIILDSKNKMGEISTYMLSLICSTQYLNANDGIILLKDLSFNTDYLYQYYCSKFKDLEGVRPYLEKVLITSDGRRSSIDINDIEVQQILDKNTIEMLIETRLLRKIISGDSSTRIEFIHDKLTEVINKKRIRSYWETLKYAYKNSNNFRGCASIHEFNRVAMFPIFSGTFLLIAASWSILGYMEATHAFTWCNIAVFILYYAFVFGVKMTIPSGIRRCHDIGISGWNVLNPFCLISLKPASAVAYKGKLSNIIINRTKTSISHIEYRSYIIQFAWWMFNYFAFSAPIMGLMYFYVIGNVLEYDIITAAKDAAFFTIFLYIGITPIFAIIYITPRRIASSKSPIWWNYIPFMPIYSFIRGFFPYKNDHIVTFNVSIFLNLGLAVILHLLLFKFIC